VGISSANASLNDHSFATAELIEVKFWLFAEKVGDGTGRAPSALSNRQGQSAARPALAPTLALAQCRCSRRLALPGA
jgi:hypothetical protein